MTATHTGPVYLDKMPNGQPVWIVADYAAARAALADPRLSKDATLLNEVQRRHLEATGQDPTLSGLFDRHMLTSDGQTHRRLHRLVSVAFAPRQMKRLRPRVQALVEQMLTSLPVDEPVDVIDQVAFPLTLTVICELLNIPEPDRAPLRGWTEAMMEEIPARTVPASAELAKYFARLIEARRGGPGTDLVSGLIEAGGSEDRLTGEELRGTLFLLLVAGHEPTANAIGNCVLDLLAQPLRWQLLGKDPDRIPEAVEELLRHDSPVRLATHRVTLEPVRIGEVTIPAGVMVMVSLQAANRDLARFDHANDVDFGRTTTGHMAFGYGPHFCLGAPLARMQLAIVLAELTRRFPDARLVVEAPQLRRKPSSIMNGLSALPVLLAGGGSPHGYVDVITGAAS